MKGFVNSIGRTCARRRGDCLGMALAGAVFVRLAPSSGEGAVAVDLMGSTLLLVGLAATAAALLYRRA